MIPSPVSYSTDAGLARITLAQPERRNVLSWDLVRSLNDALDLAARDADARVVLLSANGPAFCGGMDLKAIALDDPLQAAQFSHLLANAYRKLLTMPVPLFSAVDGPAFGGAVGLAVAADLVWAGPNARFAFPETKIGVVPALVSVIARRRLAPGKLYGLALTSIESDASQAVRLGLADFASGESAAADAEAFARKIIRDNSSEAMRRTKAFLQSEFEGDLERQLSAALDEFRGAVSTEACRRGLAAFRSKTQPDWTDQQAG